MLLTSQITASNVIIAIFVIAVLGYAGYQLFLMYRRRQAATFLKSDEFETSMRQAQIVDVREANAFQSAHILGARNVPFSSTQQGGKVPGFNKSQPIYLYDDGVIIAGKFAVKLKESGYKDVFILKGGFSNWDGKTKRRD